MVTTDLHSGAEVVLETGPVREALLARATIPGVLPAVSAGGRVLVAGAVSDDTPVGEAVRRGATEVWVLPSGSPCAHKEPPAAMLAVVLQALTLLVGQRLLRDLEVDHGVLVHLAPPLCPVSVLPHVPRRAHSRSTGPCGAPPSDWPPACPRVRTPAPAAPRARVGAPRPSGHGHLRDASAGGQADVTRRGVPALSRQTERPSPRQEAS